MKKNCGILLIVGLGSIVAIIIICILNFMIKSELNQVNNDVVISEGDELVEKENNTVTNIVINNKEKVENNEENTTVENNNKENEVVKNKKSDSELTQEIYDIKRSNRNIRNT